MREIKYFLSQTKRFFFVVPFVLLLSLALLLCLVLGFSAAAENETESEQKYELGVVGNPSDVYLKLGLAALQNLDNTRFAMHLQFLEEADAQTALENGVLDAYIIIPDDFVDNALGGDVGKLSFVTLPTALGTVDYVKDELLSVVSTVLVESQRGAYAAAEVGREYADLRYNATATDATFAYVDLILSRGKLYQVETLGVSGGLALLPSVLCGVVLFFALLLSIGFVPVFAKNDTSFHRLLAASRFGAVRQILCEYGAFLLALGVTAAILFGILFGFGGEMLSSLTEQTFDGDFFLSLAGIVAVFAAMQFFLYECTNGIATGVLSQFLCATALCYVSGCFYPVYFFPDIVQNLAPYLPTGAAHNLLAGALTGRNTPTAVAVLLVFWLFFLALAVLLRYRKQTERGGDTR